MTILNDIKSIFCCGNSRVLGKSIFTITLSLLLSLMLSACGNGTGSGDDSSGRGELIVGLTDAEGDFISYTVDVTAITLTRANGNVIDVLPLTTRVDFSQYRELTEFLTATMVPLGAYKAVSMTLDYRNADIWVENADGDPVQVNMIQDADGNPITDLEMSVELRGRNKLVISMGVPSHLTLDFDLAASNDVTFDGSGEPVQVVYPQLVVDVALQKPKARRLRGTLNNVDLIENSFEIAIQPFHHPIYEAQDFGSFVVNADSDTVYDIDQQRYLGEDGLQVLAMLPEGTPVIVHGKHQWQPWRFVAREVYAGSSVPGGSLDVVEGTVTMKTGDTLTIEGVTLIRSGGTVVFRGVVNVTLSSTTVVKTQYSMDSFTVDDINVGQEVTAFGTVSDDGMGNLTMDATHGIVRIKVVDEASDPAAG
ncbi:MAG: hypothetical protein PVF34_09685 [Gammaproteobacteria bacterium]|jgi:hypothetical protein